MEKIGEGAEAVLYKQKDVVIKERIKKGYRLAEIDDRLRKLRTRREAKILERVEKFGFTPRMLRADEPKRVIEMDFIDGDKLRDVLNEKNCRELCDEMGRRVAELHNLNIIHSDLTTSNMIIGKGKIYFIDFGLSFESTKVEDKAVDLHLLRQALESKHHLIWERAFEAVLSAYRKSAKQGAEVIRRLEIVEKRGRNKSKGS